MPAEKKDHAAPPVLEFDKNGKFLQAWGGASDQWEWPDKKVWFTSVTEQWAVIAIGGPIARKLLGEGRPDDGADAGDAGPEPGGTP